MPEDQHSSQFIDQIIEITLEELSEHQIFDDETLRRLRGLAESSGLNDSQRVVEALSTAEGK